MTAITTPIPGDTGTQRAYPWLHLSAGIVCRFWLWSIGICVLATLLPQLAGWHSYVIFSGSMEPGIASGDVVLVAPDPDLTDVVGRVISFDDPGRPGHVLTHRVLGVNDDGTLITKGDANPTPDNVPVPPEAVTGLGRLLVRFVGLPLVWLKTHQWLLILALMASLGLAVAAVLLDQEPEKGLHRKTRTPRRSGRTVRMLLVLGVGALTALVLGPVPTSTAAYSASSLNTADNWVIPNWAYTTEVNALGPWLYWKLDETGSASTAADSSGNGRTGTYNPGGGSINFTRLADGGLVTDTPDRAVRLVSSGACINTTSTTAVPAPQIFTLIVWFRAPATYTNGGKLIGFERPRTGVAAPLSGQYDRHIYMDGQGRIWFGIGNPGNVAINSATGLNNYQWHMAVGTQSGAGMRLYIDGVQVASNGNTSAMNYMGWWRVGCGNLAGWGSQWGGSNNPGTSTAFPQNRVFTQSVDEATVYVGAALTASQVAWLYWVR